MSRIIFNPVQKQKLQLYPSDTEFVKTETDPLSLHLTGGTLTGDLLLQPTVDSLTNLVVNDKDANNILTIDSINNRLGVKTATPLLSLDIAGSGRFTGSTTSVLTGSIDPTASTTVVGVGTKFLTELVVGDRITVTGVTKTVTAIASDTSLTVDTAFTDLANDTSPDKLAAIFIARDSSNAVKMVVNDLGNVGIGTTEPGVLLDLSFNGDTKVTSVGSRITNTGASASNNNGAFTLLIEDDGAALANGDRLGGFLFSAAKDASHTLVNAAGVVAYANENWGASNAGSYLTFETTTNNSTTRTEKLRIDNGGNVGIGTTGPDKKLEINLGTSNALRLTYNDANGSAAVYSDFTLSSTGVLNIAPTGLTATVTGRLASTATSVTIATAATTFAVASNVVTVTGDALANIVATITGGISGQMLTLIFVDALVTITDTAAATADTVNLSAAFVGAANTTLTLVHNGTKWFETARSIN